MCIVAQPVLEKKKNRRKTKENIEKELQDVQIVVVEEKKLKSTSSLPKKATTLRLRQQSQK